MNLGFREVDLEGVRGKIGGMNMTRRHHTNVSEDY